MSYYYSSSFYINLLCVVTIVAHQLLAWYLDSWLWSSVITACVLYTALHGLEVLATGFHHLSRGIFVPLIYIAAVPLYLLSWLVSKPLAACGCMDEETLSIDDNDAHAVLFFEDHPHCPRCNVEIPEEQCYLKGYVGHNDNDSEYLSEVNQMDDTRKVYTTAGYFRCEQCDDVCPGMERLTVELGRSNDNDGAGTAITTIMYRALPHFIKRWAYTGWRLCDPDEHTNCTEIDYYGPGKDRKRQYVWHNKCSACGKKLNHRRHTLIERVRQWGPLNLVTNYVGIDECLNQRCRHREWFSRTVPF